MARKRTAKPTKPPAAAPSPNQENQIEALATFLDTGSPLCKVPQPPNLPATMTAFPSEEDTKKAICEYDEQRLRKIIDKATKSYNDGETRMLASKVGQMEGFQEYQSQFRDARVLHDLKLSIDLLKGHISNDEQVKLHAKLQSITEQMKVTPLYIKVLLNHPNGSPNENAFEQEAAVQKILREISDLEENIKIWESVNTVNKSKEPTNDAQGLAKETKRPVRGRGNLTHEDKKQSAIKAYMKKFNIDEATATHCWSRVHWTRLLEADIIAQTCDEVEMDTANTIPRARPLTIRSGQIHEPVLMPPTDTQSRELTANAKHSSPEVGDVRTDVSVPEPNAKTEFEVKTDKEQPAIQDLGAAEVKNAIAVDTEPLPTAITIMYADVSQPGTILDLWIAFWNDDNDDSAREALYGYLMGFPESARDGTWECHMDWLVGGKYKLVAQDGPKPARDDTCVSHMDWLAGGKCESVSQGRRVPNTWSEVTARKEDKKFSHLKEELVLKPNKAQKPNSKQLMKRLEKLQNRLQGVDNIIPIDNMKSQRVCFDDLGNHEVDVEQDRVEWVLNVGEEKLKQREDRLKKCEGEQQKLDDISQVCTTQRQEIEKLLKQREERLHNHERQQRMTDELLLKRERDIKAREVQWEKHQQQRQEIEKLLQQREVQLQKRDDKLQAREAMVLTHEDRWVKREEQLLNRERLLDHRERAAETRITSLNQQATDLQADMEKGEAKLAHVLDSHQRAKRAMGAQEDDLRYRVQEIEHREKAMEFREEWVKENFKALMAGATNSYTSWGKPWTGDWPSVLELAVKVRAFIETRNWEWSQNMSELADIKRAAVKVEEDAKKMVFSGDIMGAAFPKIAETMRWDENITPVSSDADKTPVAANQLDGWNDNIPIATSTDSVGPSTWPMYEPDKLPASNPANDCSGKWGCKCASCLKREENWRVHMQSSDKNGANKVSPSHMMGDAGRPVYLYDKDNFDDW
ncbi:hypothetical protein V491_02809 [Pseudogymnoascus sp. VKM F-3775]|nr:hypothetical protein V491_02809 [Pseudogymnoascus sp. VKM F-3775]